MPNVSKRGFQASGLCMLRPFDISDRVRITVNYISLALMGLRDSLPHGQTDRNSMLKPASSIHEEDPRFRHFVTVEHGVTRPMSAADLYGMIEPIQLSNYVPEDIQREFDTARNAFIYSWFVYEFTTLAELGSFTALELALRRRLFPAELGPSRSPGLSRLLKAAVEAGYLSRSDFEVASPSGNSPAVCQLDLVPMLRNHIAHGNVHLMPDGALASMRLCQAIIDKLYA